MRCSYRPALWATTVLLLTGCASVSPRFSTPIASAFAKDRMRRIETEQVVLYYPESEKARAISVLRRLDGCLSRLTTTTRSHEVREQAVVYLTTSQFNNAYVYPEALGTPQHMVLPTHFTLEEFNWLGEDPADVGDVSCHESVHYVQMQQVDGFWRFVNSLFGATLQPNVFTEPWFLEGLATYYEGRLGREVGRPHSPVWSGVFHAWLSEHGRISAGDLSPDQRELWLFGGHYLVGMHFVDFLARRYGEKKLWELVDLQGHSVFSYFGVTLRFWSVYGKTIGALIEEYNDEIASHPEHRRRPATQQVLADDLGYAARLTASPAGVTASLTVGLDEVVSLTVREPGGAVRFSRRLTPLLFVRPWITAHPLQASGMSFTADGSRLFLMIADVDSDQSESSRLLEFDARDGRFIRGWDLSTAMGGSVRPDGGRYVYIETRGGNLKELDLSTGASTELTGFPDRAGIGPPAYSPDGQRIAFARRVGEGFSIFLRQPDGAIEQQTFGGNFDYSPRWLDSERLIFLRDRNGRAQVHLFELGSRSIRVLTDVPHLALDPCPIGQTGVAFLNRDGSTWTLDRVDLGGSAPAETLRSTQQKETRSPDVPTSGQTARILEDQPYSSFDHLFVPVLHAPFIYAEMQGNGQVGWLAGASLQGGDRLSFHNWALNATVSLSPFDLRLLSGGYGNEQFAPWYWQIDGARNVQRGLPSAPDTIEYQADLTVSRPYWTTPVAFRFRGADRLVIDPSGESRSRFAGPGAQVDYAASERTPYGGKRRSLSLSASGDLYPGSLGSQPTFADLRGELGFSLPLPLSARHGISFDFRGRGLPGAPGLLQIGGVPYGSTLIDFGAVSQTPLKPLPLPSTLLFVEPLRGYEDVAFRATYAAIGGARYRYPLIIDQGFSSFLYLLPSWFIRQVDLELFAQASWSDSAFRLHRSVGGALFLRTVFGGVVPFSFFVQAADRFDEAVGPYSLAGIAFE